MLIIRQLMHHAKYQQEQTAVDDQPELVEPDKNASRFEMAGPH